MILKILLVAFILILFQVYFETNFPKLAVISIKTNKFKNKGKVKVLQITDYHNFKYNNRVLKLVKEDMPDLIVITGDLIDKRTKDYANVYNFLENLYSLNENIFYVPGNHERNSKSISSLLEGISKRNIRVLLNSSCTKSFKEYQLNICGIDYSLNQLGDLNKTLQGIDCGHFTILLSHKPDVVIDHKNIGCDLILCGHTHGGQIRFPFMGAAIAPDQGFLPKFNKGIYKLEKNTVLYVDSGVGTTRLPIRFMNRSQVNLIEIESN